MASMKDSSFPLRIFVDKERNEVVVAEASRDFVDALFSFFTLPLGTIMRLLSAEIGCINNLYRSVKNFNTQVFWNEICKKMLLCPRNPCEKLCKKLRFNVDDTEPTKYWICGFCSESSRKFGLLSTFAGVSCSSCGKPMSKEMKLKGEEDHCKGDDVFVRGHLMYLIFDDLKVLQNSPGNTVKQLVQLGYADFPKLTAISTKVGLSQIMDLLKRALVSKSPLSDVFLALEDGGSNPMSSFRPVLAMAPSQSRRVSNPVSESDSSLKLKITVSKSTNKIMYVEAEADFSDFLFSFLTMPLGSVLKLLDGNVTLGSMQNLYESVKDLSSITDTRLLDLKVASQYGCVRQPLELGEEEIPIYFPFHDYYSRSSLLYVANKENASEYECEPMKHFDPRSADGTREAAVGFVRRPSLFVVMDDLQVLPLTSTSSMSFLQKLNIPLNDFEEHEVKIGMIEALNLLGASVTSKAALTNGLSYHVKKPKKEAKA